MEWNQVYDWHKVVRRDPYTNEEELRKKNNQTP